MRFFAVSLVWLFLLFWKSYIKEIDQGSYGFTRSKFISKHFYKKNITKDNSSRDHLKILFDDLINIATTLSYLDTKITDLLINVFFLKIWILVKWYVYLLTIYFLDLLYFIFCYKCWIVGDNEISSKNYSFRIYNCKFCVYYLKERQYLQIKLLDCKNYGFFDEPICKKISSREHLQDRIQVKICY